MINMLFMEYTKHLQHVSNEYELIVIKYQEIHLRTSILICFGALEPVWGRLGNHPGMGTLKTSKTNITLGNPPFGTYL